MRWAVLLLLPLLAGCSSVLPYDGPPFAGRWGASHDDHGVVRLEIEGEGELQCALTDVQRRRFEFEGSPTTEAEGAEGGFEVELRAGELGIKTLVNQPPDGLQVKGTMNYAMGRVQVAFRRTHVDGREVIRCTFYRASRPEKTRQSIHLTRLAPAPEAAGGE